MQLSQLCCCNVPALWFGILDVCTLRVRSPSLRFSPRCGRIPFLLATLFALFLASLGTLERQLVLFERTFLLLALGSAVLALGFPRLGLDASTGHAGNWQGVFTQKNACGRAMVFASAVVLAQGRLNLRRVSSLLLFSTVLILSGSRGAWAIEAGLLALAAVYGLLARFDAKPRRWLVAATIALSVLSIVLGRLCFARLVQILGRAPTLTGRTSIWAQVWIEILKRPWLGYGFSAFWRGTKGASFEVVVALKFILFHAHNGFLEILLELGAAGLLLFVLSYAVGCRHLQRSLWSRSEDRGTLYAAWPLFMLFLVLAYDLDENTLLSFNGLFWVLYVHALVSLQQPREVSCPRASDHLDQSCAGLWFGGGIDEEATAIAGQASGLFARPTGHIPSQTEQPAWF